MNTRSRCLVVLLLACLLGAPALLLSQSASARFEQGLLKENAEGTLDEAIVIFKGIAEDKAADPAIRAKAQLHIGICYEKLGLEKAREAFEEVIRNYPGEVATVAMARQKLDGLLRTSALANAGAAELTIRNVQIPSKPPLELYRVSPDGKYLSYVDGNTGDLGVREFSTGNLRLLTNEGKDYSQYAYAPRWSPDSARLAFAWQRRDGMVELRVIALDGSQPRVVVPASESEAPVAPLDWSPDGVRVLTTFYNFKQKGRAPQLRLVFVADGSGRTLTAFKDNSLAPSVCLFSPDGRSVAYSRPSREGARERDVFLFSLDDSREIPLVEHPADDTLLEWLPDGRGILFASDRAGTTDLWMVRVEKGLPAGAPILIRRSIGPVTPMGLTRMGAFYYRTPGSFLDVFTASFDPKTGNVAGSPRKEPLPFEGHNRMPEWSPDGKHLAYVSMRPGERTWVVCIYSAETGKVREFRPENAGAYPSWAPDGRYLYLLAPGVNGRGIYRMDVQSGEATPFLGADAEEAVFSLRTSPDQQWIVYARDGKSIDRVIRRDARSGQEKELDRGPDIRRVALSADGSRLAWVLKTDEKTNVLKVMEFPDGTPREIQKLAMTGSWTFDIGWSPDGRFIYYSDVRPGVWDAWHLWRIPAEGGTVQDLGLTSGFIERISVHPDGTRITFSAPPTTREPPQVLVMENFLPVAKEAASAPAQKVKK